jgi:hypothetical protein
MNSSHCALVTRRLQQHLMGRAFVVEGEALARKADAVNAGRQIDEFARCGSRMRRLPVGIIGRRRRVLREGMQNVGEDQLLMLLLVMEADLENAQHLREHRFLGTRKQPANAFIDMRAERGDLLAARPCQEPAARPRVTRSGRHVVRVEEISEPLVEQLIAGEPRDQQELL